LDLDGDRSLSAAELGKAAESLAELDKDGDGSIALVEIRPDRGAGDRGPFPDRDRFEFDRPERPRPLRREGGKRSPQDGPPQDRPAGLGGPPGGPMIERIMGFDADDDGKLSPEELPERMLRIMERADANEDGLIDRTELEKLRDQMRDRFGDRPGRPERGARPPRPEE
jgi:hypothetical protein